LISFFFLISYSIIIIYKWKTDWSCSDLSRCPKNRSSRKTTTSTLKARKCRSRQKQPGSPKKPRSAMIWAVCGFFWTIRRTIQDISITFRKLMS